MQRNQFLIEKGLSTAEPYKQKNLLPLEKQTPNRDHLDVINGYDIQNEKIFCHICALRLHNKGFTGQTDKNELLLFGSCCAKKFFEKSILESAMRSYELRKANAEAQFNISKIQATLGDINSWLTRNEGLIRSTASTWTCLQDESQDFINELFDHLDKNGNRLTQEFVQEASSISIEANRNQRLVTRKIVIALGNEHGRRRVFRMWDDFRLIRQFTAALDQFDDETSIEKIKDADRKMRSNLFKSIDDLDAAMKFSVEFFADGTLEKIADWSDKERDIRLRHLDEIKPRNLKKSLRKRLGYAFQMPDGNLRQIIGSEQFLLNAIGEGEDLGTVISPLAGEKANSIA